MKDFQEISIFWFRRDLRLKDNCGLHHALNASFPVLCVFIFDDAILSELNNDDPRVDFIYQQLQAIDADLKLHSSSLLIKKGNVRDVWQELINKYTVRQVFVNHDYEPYAIGRDKQITSLLKQNNIKFHTYKDQVIFEKDEILKADASPYVVYTPYKNKWLQRFSDHDLQEFESSVTDNFAKLCFDFPNMKSLGFRPSTIKVPDFNLADLSFYEERRDYPSLDYSSKLSTHLRFGTISIRSVIREIVYHSKFLNELIWREFFMQILYHFPDNEKFNFKRNYDFVQWRNNEEEFAAWKNGMTGYPIVDAGMRELKATGLMHNRVRMICAGFLCKHLLIDWRWGEAYFASKLLDYELASNNGNWQWAAGTGCDAAPYFRIFNPLIQAKKFDADEKYIRKWIPEYGTPSYPLPIVDHKFAGERAIKTYKQALSARQ